MVEDPFFSARQRLARADLHLADLADRIEAFFERDDCYKGLIKPFGDGQRETRVIRFTERLPVVWRVLACEVIEHARSALDHAAFATAALSGRPGAKSAHFPIAETPADLENGIKGRCKDIPSDIHTLFRSLKPYQGGNDLLWTLNNLCNASKHKLLPLIVGTAGRIRLQGPGGRRGIIPYRPFWDPDENEIAIATTYIGDEFTYDVDLTFYVAFGEIGAVADYSAPGLLDEICGEALAVVGAIEAECRRLGLLPE